MANTWLQINQCQPRSRHSVASFPQALPLLLSLTPVYEFLCEFEDSFARLPPATPAKSTSQETPLLCKVPYCVSSSSLVQLFCTHVRTYTVLRWKQGPWTSQGLDPLGQEEVASNRTAGTGVPGPGVGRRSTCACCRPGPGPLAQVHDSYRGAALARDDRPYRTRAVGAIKRVRGEKPSWFSLLACLGIFWARRDGKD